MPDAPVQEPPKHMQLANPDAIPTSRMTVLFMVMLISAAGNTAMQSVLPAIGTQLGVADYWISAAFTWSAVVAGRGFHAGTAQMVTSWSHLSAVCPVVSSAWCLPVLRTPW